MRFGLTLTLVLLVSLMVMPACASSEERIKAEDDKIVVECAEQMLWDFSYIASPEFGSTEASHIDFLATLAEDDIFLFEDEHPFKDKAWLFYDKGYKSYIAFKADFYREMFEWDRLPPADIMEQCGIEPPQE
jgi:hypothetical protein